LTPERTPGEQEVSRSERTVTVPIGEMDEPAGYLSIRAPVRGRDEIGQLARQFNHMAEQLKASFASWASSTFTDV